GAESSFLADATAIDARTAANRTPAHSGNGSGTVSAGATAACQTGCMRIRARTHAPATEPVRGRGSASFVDGRFQQRPARLEDDGWDGLPALAEEAARSRLDTVVAEERARSIVSRNRSP